MNEKLPDAGTAARELLDAAKALAHTYDVQQRPEFLRLFNALSTYCLAVQVRLDQPDPRP